MPEKTLTDALDAIHDEVARIQKYASLDDRQVIEALDRIAAIARYRQDIRTADEIELGRNCAPL